MKERKMKLIRNQKGFTLVEMAIVLVIIGLILGAVLKGQDLINNARMKRLYNLQQEINAGVNTYMDKYGKYPGDDNRMNARWAITNGNNDGVITGFTTTCASGAATETCLAWRALRLANILAGDTTSAINPNNPYGGIAALGTGAGQGLATQWIGFTGVWYDVCQILGKSYVCGSPPRGWCSVTIA